MGLGIDARNEVKSQLFLEVLCSFGTARLTVTGDSMLPAVWPGDVLEVCREAAAEMLPGELALFTRGGRMFAHRIVKRVEERGETLLITRGDRLRKPDPPVLPEELLGRVMAIERNNRRLDPGPTLLAAIVSWVLCRSEFVAGLLLRIRGVVWHKEQDRAPSCPVIRSSEEMKA